MKRFTWLCSYLVEFIVCAFCGWLYEEALELIVYHQYTDRGMLHMPICPIYGFFAMILIVLFRNRRHWALVFFVSAFVTTVLELVSSYVLEYFSYVPWDYSGWFCNFEGRISLPSSLIFGGLALLLVRAVHPLMRRFAKAAPRMLVCTLGILFGILLLGDTIWTFLLYK